MDAVHSGNTDLLEELLKNIDNQNLDFHVFNYFGNHIGIWSESPLTGAIRGENYDMVEQLLCAGADVNFQEESGFTPLMEACWLKNFDICQLLLKHGANVHLISTFGSSDSTALFWAGCFGDLEIVKLLLEHGAHIFDPSLQVEEAIARSPIATPVLYDHPQIANFFLEQYKTEEEPYLFCVCLLILFDVALGLGSEKCAIAVLKEGYYPAWEGLNEPYFRMAANHGMIELMSLLVGMNAQFVQEDWLIQKQLPDKLVQHTDFVSWLVEYRKQTPSLQKLCKSRILYQLVSYHSSWYMPKIDALPLPKILRTYLAAVEPAYYCQL